MDRYGSGFLDALGKNPQRPPFHARHRFGRRCPTSDDAGKLRDFREPTTIVLTFDFEYQLHGAVASMHLGSRFELPAREDKNGRMAMQGRAKHLGPLDTKVDSTILDAGNGGLWNTTQRGELGLAETLQLANDPHRFTRSDIDALLGRNELAHISVSDSHIG